MPKIKTGLTEAIAEYNPKPSLRRGNLWQGPTAPGPHGGITFSMLTNFLSCRERFRVKYVEGWRPTDGFNHKMEYGNLWHVCEEHFAAEKDWTEPLKAYARDLCLKHPTQQEAVDKWYRVCKLQFPEYVKYWQANPDVKQRTPLLQEYVFDIPYRLPSGRTVRLRGKYDSVDIIGKGKGAGVYLQENKTKGDVNVIRLQRQLTGDLQTMMYLVSLQEVLVSLKSKTGNVQSVKLCGTRYNVIRRPLSGGKGSITQLKPTKANPQGESKEQYYNRVAQYIIDEPQEYFWRWKTDVSKGDIDTFRRQTLDPIFEQLCDWWDWLANIKGEPFDVKGHGGIHWRHPFGSVNALDEYGATEFDDYLMTGNSVGLSPREHLFEELSV